jgi:hypothetical protein
MVASSTSTQALSSRIRSSTKQRAGEPNRKCGTLANLDSANIAPDVVEAGGRIQEFHRAVMTERGSPEEQALELAARLHAGPGRRGKSPCMGRTRRVVDAVDTRDETPSKHTLRCGSVYPATCEGCPTSARSSTGVGPPGPWASSGLNLIKRTQAEMNLWKGT